MALQKGDDIVQILRQRQPDDVVILRLTALAATTFEPGTIESILTVQLILQSSKGSGFIHIIMST